MRELTQENVLILLNIGEVTPEIVSGLIVMTEKGGATDFAQTALREVQNRVAALRDRLEVSKDVSLELVMIDRMWATVKIVYGCMELAQLEEEGADIDKLLEDVDASLLD